jgi:predicted dehydrogenase
VAIIGAGNMAREHVRAFSNVRDVEVAGIYSRTRSRAEALAAEYGISAVCDSVRELHERTEANLVVVTVPELSMNSVSRACFPLPWTVLLEKPPGYNLEDCLAIESAAIEHGSRVYVAMNRRCFSSTIAALTDLAASDEPRWVTVLDQQSMREAAESGKPDVVAANYMFANSIHLVDYFHVLCRGRIVEVTPIVQWNSERPGIVVSKIRFDTGDGGLYQAAWNGPGPWAVSVSTPAKRWELRPLEQAAFQLAGERRLSTVPAHEWDRSFKPGFRLQAAEAAAAAIGEGPKTLPRLSEIVATMKLVQAIYFGGLD